MSDKGIMVCTHARSGTIRLYYLMAYGMEIAGKGSARVAQALRESAALGKVQLTGDARMKKREVIRVFQLFSGVMITLFVAGILVPSLLGSTKSVNHNLFPGTLHTIHIAGMAFRYKLQNILAALVGTLFGAVTALVLSSRAARKKNTGSLATAHGAAGEAGSARLAGLDLMSSFRQLAGILHFSRLK
jgi:hypothetical protein